VGGEPCPLAHAGGVYRCPRDCGYTVAYCREHGGGARAREAGEAHTAHCAGGPGPDSRPPARVYATGIAGLDERLEGGLRARDLHVLAAPPGTGKTYLVGQIAVTMARALPVLWVATEMDIETQAARLAALVVPCRPGDIMDRRVDPCRAAEAVADLPIYLERVNPFLVRDSIARIRGLAAAVEKVRGRAPAVVVDYLQMLGGDADPNRMRGTIGRLAYQLGALAQSLDVPILAVSSVSRGYYGPAARDLARQTDPRAWLAFAKESGDIEFAAAVILALDTGEPDAAGMAPARIIAAKVRRGSRGFIGLRFDGPGGRFLEEAAAVEEMGPARREAEADRRVLNAIAVTRERPRSWRDLRGKCGIGARAADAACERLRQRVEVVVRRVRTTTTPRRRQEWIILASWRGDRLPIGYEDAEPAAAAGEGSDG